MPFVAARTSAFKLDNAAGSLTDISERAKTEERLGLFAAAIEGAAEGIFIVDLEGRLPVSRRSRDVELDLFERWQLISLDQWACVEYAYELRHHEIGYRRALHRHDEAYFVRMYGVATHEHCEATMGVEVCHHYYGQPVADAFDGFRRLYEIWLTDDNPRTEDPRAIIEQILSGMRRPEAAHVVSDRAEAIQRGIGLLEPGDVLVIAGKGHEDYQILGNKRIHFDDREEAFEVKLSKLEPGPHSIAVRATDEEGNVGVEKLSVKAQ